MSDTHFIENLQAQRDDAIARIEAMEADRHCLQQDHNNALSAKDAEHQAALAKQAEDHAAALAAKDSALAEMKAFVDACGVTEAGQAILRQRKREALLKAHEDAKALAAQHAADLAALEA